MQIVVLVMMLSVPAALMYYFNKKIETNPDTKRREKALERF
jgi:hypothetical protein